MPWTRRTKIQGERGYARRVVHFYEEDSMEGLVLFHRLRRHDAISARWACGDWVGGAHPAFAGVAIHEITRAVDGHHLGVPDRR